MKTAWVFPGQGSQAVGMVADLLEQAPEKFAQAERILGWSVVDLCQGNLETLSETQFTQPCLYVVECVLVDLLKAQGHQPDIVAGHSLGEYVALYTAGVFDFETGLRLVKCRSELMAQASDGMMAALMGFDREELMAAIATTPDVVLANDNNPGQAVISGTPAAVESVMASVRSRRAVPLKVSGAFHSPLMARAAAQFKVVLDLVQFNNAQVAVLSNVEPEAATEGLVLKARLVQQMTGSVRWRETALQLPELKVEQVVEVGPGKVLNGLIKRTCKGLKLENVETAAAIAELPVLALVGMG
ncbi:MAG: ACP S-malonyltransferase [Synechococcales cyanobacterium CRU_2_2]|nr:ACP S-malonyltransferase [Synechococcales cyanobacterium CRU_2_2]